MKYSHKLYFFYVVIIILLNSCANVSEEKKPQFKYQIEYPNKVNARYYSTSEIEYMPNGCIKFVGFAYGQEDTILLCGSYLIKKYR